MPTIDSNASGASASTSKNFTPINKQKYQASAHSKLNLMIVVIAVVTALILALIMIMLFRTP